jgi:hypothetical protein
MEEKAQELIIPRLYDSSEGAGNAIFSILKDLVA